jgi:hypothetical protein
LEADQVLNDLARLSASLRQAGTSYRLTKADKTFERTDAKHSDLRAHLTRIVLDLFVNDSQLTVVQNRLNDANLRRSHCFAYCRGHGQKLESLSQPPLAADNGTQNASNNLAVPRVIVDKIPGVQSHEDTTGPTGAATTAEEPVLTGEIMPDMTASAMRTLNMGDLTDNATSFQQTATAFRTTESRI